MARVVRRLEEAETVEWWRVLVLVADLYILLSLGAWVALRFSEWRLLRSGPFLADEAERLRMLQKAHTDQAAFWPERPRAGRYAQPDHRAQETLNRLTLTLAEASRMRLALGDHSMTRLSPVQVLLFGAWPPLVRALNLVQGRRTLRNLLSRARTSLRTLQNLYVEVDQIPLRVRGELKELRAEANRLAALAEAEQAAGTVGLQEVIRRLSLMQREIDAALDRLAESSDAQMPALTRAIDARLAPIAEALPKMDRFLQNASEARVRAHNLADRVQSSLALAEERWMALKEQGAKDPEVDRALLVLNTQAERLSEVVKNQTLDVYERAREHVSELDAQIEALTTHLDELDSAIRESRAAIEEDAQTIAEVHGLCRELMRREPLLKLDQSQALLDEAGAAYQEAERQQALGTLAGYQQALLCSQRAKEHLTQSMDLITAVADQAFEVRELLSSLSAEVLGDWHSRVARLREQLQVYAKHWQAGLSADVAEAVSNLEQVEVDLERIPPNVRYQRLLRQSELRESLDILHHAESCMERAKELVTALEEEAERIEGLRAQAAQAMRTLGEQMLPAIAAENERMLAGRQQRLLALRARFAEQVKFLNDPSQVDYDELVEQRLPAMADELDALRVDHEEDIRQYRKALRETIGQLNRAWSRLEKLDPYEGPRAEEDVESLGRDLSEWQVMTRDYEDDPVTLQRLVGREAAVLQGRIQRAQDQIVEGRRSLEALSKEYLRHAQRVRELRASIDEARRQSRWGHLRWELDEAERVWEKALALERDSRAADSLVQANNQLQLATNAAQQAEQLYDLASRQVVNALTRLDDEWEAAANALERGKQRTRELRHHSADGEPMREEVVALEELCVNADRTLREAQQTETFEQALRHLRDAGNMLARA